MRKKLNFDLESFAMISKAIDLFPNDKTARNFRFYLSTDAQDVSKKSEDLEYII